MSSVPPWLESLLRAAFFSACRTHRDSARSECNMYCLDCRGDSFCFYCRSSKHKEHQVIQIRRSSYHDVVRVGEVEKVLDISGVQTYVINSSRVMFLNERPQPKPGRGGGGGGGGGVGHVCEICGRSLLDPLRFCSLGCKLAGIKRNGNARFSREGKNEGAIDEEEEEEEEGSTLLEMQERIARRSRAMMSSSSPNEQEEEDMYKATPSSNARRRKGIPHRAPFFAS
ncbi:Protein RGF1 INDUCIBLE TRANSCRIPTION FACTOR 1 [Linum grandiflorum]